MVLRANCNMSNSSVNAANLLRAMDSTKNEREIQRYLKTNTVLVLHAFNRKDSSKLCFGVTWFGNMGKWLVTV